MMKRIFLPVIAAVALASCSDISEDERFIPIDSVAPQRAVLLEEFTGQNCPNCPSAHKEIETLLSQYGDALIPVSIHAGDFGISCTARRPGLMQPEGDTFNNRYGIDEWPKGVVNGRGGAMNFDEWSDAIRAEAARETTLGMELSAEIAPGDPATISITGTLMPAADLAGRLYVWITEDHIIARQLDKELGTIADYEHNHVYRASATAVEGDAVSLRSHVHTTLDYTVEVRATEKETWNTANLSVVAFVREPAGGVAQATRVHVTPATAE